mgnify:FL=1
MFGVDVLKTRMRELIPEKQMVLADLKKNYGNVKLADLTVNHVSEM